MVAKCRPGRARPWVLLCPGEGPRHPSLFKVLAASGQRWPWPRRFQGLSCQPGPALQFPLQRLQLVPICYFTHLIYLPKKFLV